MLRFLFTAIIVVFFAGVGEAATYTAADCTYAAVNTAVASAVDGDTVIVPAGTCTWSIASGHRLIIGSSTSTNKGIKLRGDPNGDTIIYSNSGASLGCQGDRNIIEIFEDVSHHVEVFDFTFGDAGGGCGGGNQSWYIMQIKPKTGNNGKPVLLHDNNCALPRCVRFVRSYTGRGIIYRNTFSATEWHGPETNDDNNTRQFASCTGATRPFLSLPTYGVDDPTGTLHFYVEDNTLHAVTTATDFYESCRAVVRHNRFEAAHVGTHGLDSGGAGSSSARHGEVYGNAFVQVFDPQAGPTFGAGNTGYTQWVSARGGSWRIFSNSMDNFNHGFGAVAARLFALSQAATNCNGQTCWWSCWGTASNPLHGTNGTNNFAGAQYPLAQQAGLGWNGGSVPGVNYSVASQPSGASVSGYIIEGIYVWNNTGSEDSKNSVVFGSTTAGQCPSPDSHAGYIQQNRDWFNSAPAGYTACDTTYYSAAAGLDCNYPHRLRHDQTSNPGSDVTGPIITVGLPGVAADTTAATGTASGVCTDTQGTCAASGSASNSQNSDTASVTVSGSTWTMGTIDYALGLNPVTVTIADNSANNGQGTFTVFRDDCGSTLPYSNTFSLYGTATSWSTVGPCWTQYGVGLRHVISNNAMLAQSGTCEAFIGQALPANQYISGRLGTVSGNSGPRFMVRMSGTAGQSDNRYGIFLQVAPTNTFIGRYMGPDGFDHIFENYTASIGTPVANTTTARLEISGNIATGYVDIDGSGPGAEVQLSPAVDITQSVGSGPYPIANGPTGVCFDPGGASVDNIEIGSVTPVELDTEPPVVTITAPDSGTVVEDAELSSGALDGTAADNVAATSCEYEVSTAPGFVALSLAAGVFTNPFAIPLAVGSNTIFVRCLDNAVNSGTAAINIVRENTPDPLPASRPKRRPRGF